jgi:hypothetical protein
MRIEFHIVDDEDLPPLTIAHDEGLFPIVYLNQHHRLWLGLMRNAIPGVAVQLQDKLTELCDGYLREQIAFQVLDRGERDDE